jgi:hypothetical protein
VPGPARTGYREQWRAAYGDLRLWDPSAARAGAR